MALSPPLVLVSLLPRNMASYHRSGEVGEQTRPLEEPVCPGFKLRLAGSSQARALDTL